MKAREFGEVEVHANGAPKKREGNFLRGKQTRKQRTRELSMKTDVDKEEFEAKKGSTVEEVEEEAEGEAKKKK